MLLLHALLLSHLIADFLFPAKFVKWAKQSVGGLVVHTAVYSALTAVVLYRLRADWLFLLAILAFSHFFIDFLKYLINAALSSGGLLIFLVDQTLHLATIIFIFFKAGFVPYPAFSFLSLVSQYEKLLPYLVGYISVTFAASILVFEAGRSFNPEPTRHPNNNAIVTFKERFPGMIERALAISFIIGRLYFLFPLSFAFSIYQLAKKWKTSLREKFLIELITSFLSAIIVGVFFLI